MNPALKPLVCAVLAVSTILAPWGSGLLPGPVGTLATEPAAALAFSGTVVPGIPKPCPATPFPWEAVPTADGPECRLRMPACPESLLFGPGSFSLMSSAPAWLVDMGLAAEFPTPEVGQPPIPGVETYPDFCEERALDELATAPEYSVCVNMTGVAVKSYEESGITGCRLLRPIQCPAGLYQVTSRTCEGLVRRTWSCPMTTDTRRNAFNTCYRDTGVVPATTPWCDAGSPTFAIASCEDYVGNDIVTTPLDCATDFPTNTPVLARDGTQAVAAASSIQLETALVGGVTNRYWCQYDARYLSDECHRTDDSHSDCAVPIPSLCIQRASRTGGCDTVAHNIRCNAFEAAWRQGQLTVTYVRQNGCTPCDVLPFGTVKEAGFGRAEASDWDTCPRDAIGPPYVGRPGYRIRNGRPAPTETSDLARAHDDAAGTSACAKPPSGSITWQSNHSSGLAVVNSGVVALIGGIDIQRLPWPIHQHVIAVRPGYSPVNFFSSRRRLVYRQDTSDDPAVRLRPAIDPSSATTYSTISSMMAGLAGECDLYSDPTFRLIVRELWPDNGPEYEGGNPNCVPVLGGHDPNRDAELIIELFGDDALAWWCALTLDQRQVLSIAKGYGWWEDLDSTARMARTTRLVETMYCDFGLSPGTWCRWTPSRASYYALHVGGAWELQQHVRKSDAVAGGRFGTWLTYLNDADARTARHQLLDDELNYIGRFEPRSYADLGIQVDSVTGDFVGIPIAGTDLDWWYSSDSYPNSNCPPIDLRARCNALVGQITAYSTSERIGVIVHEARVVTRSPS